MRSRERGSAAIELPFLAGLVLIPFGLVVLVFPLWVERQAAARDGAAEAARVLAHGGTPAEAAAVLDAIESGYGLGPDALGLAAVEVGPAGTELEVTVSVVLPGFELPIFGSVGQTSWTARHRERAPDFGADP